jgi:hypothetical protein
VLIDFRTFLIIYHFTLLNKSVTFEEGRIKEFIKYLDNSTVNRSLIKTNKSYVKEFIEANLKENFA